METHYCRSILIYVYLHVYMHTLHVYVTFRYTYVYVLIYTFVRITLHCGNNIPTRHQRPKLQCQEWVTSLKLLTAEVPQTPQTLQDIVNALGCPPKHNSKMLLLKTPCTLLKEYGDIKLVLAWKLAPCQFSQCWKVLFTPPEEKFNQQSYPAVNSESNNHWPGNTSPLVQQWHEHHSSNQPYFDQI